MAGDGADVERRGLSRRDMIRASAAAGVTAWTAPMIIDSFASPAAAASGCVGSTVTLSWIYILYQVGGTFYITGFSKDDTACNDGGTNTHGTHCADCTSATGFTLTINDFASSAPPNPATNDLTFSTGGCAGTQSNNWTFQNSTTPSPGCGFYIQFNNGVISGQNGAVILAAVGFGANTLRTICPTNNSVCSIEL